MSTAETPTPLPLTVKQLDEIRALPKEGREYVDIELLLSTIDHYKALSTGRVEGVDTLELEKYEAILEAIRRCIADGKMMHAIPILKATEANARAQAPEEAAKVADTFDNALGEQGIDRFNRQRLASRGCGTAIRALVSQ